MVDRIANLGDYRRLRKSFEWQCPEYFNFGFDVVDRLAADRPDGIAIHWVGPNDERTFTFAELAARSNQFAAALGNLGLARENKVLVILPRVIPWWETLVGVFKAGMVAIPGTTLLTARDIAHRAQAAEAVAIVTDEAAATKVEQVTHQLPGLQHKILVSDNARTGWHS